MLRAGHVRPFVSEENGGVRVDFLRDPDGRVTRLLDRIIALVRRLEGAPRHRVVEALRRQERRVRDERRLAGIGKSLLDRCRFRSPRGAEQAAEVREALFLARGSDWPPTPGGLRAPYRAAADALGVDEVEIERLLYADRPDALLLTRAPRLAGKRLLALYNLDLARGVLLDAVRVRISARGRWGDVFRSIKLARLMYRTRRVDGGGYEVELTGPAAPYLVSTRRYGARFARIVPPLTRAPGWRVEADIEREGRLLSFVLDAGAPVAGSGGRGRPRYDSSWERSLAEDFSKKLGEERAGWTLRREADPIDLGDELLLPDFTFRHRDGREALVEIVGFWTPEYLERKMKKLAAADIGHLVLVVYRELAVGEEALADALEAVAPGRVLWFAKKPVIRDVMEAVERVAVVFSPGRRRPSSKPSPERGP